MAQQPPSLPPRNPVIHNAALFGAVVTPLAMLLPPRKLDVRFLVLAGAFSLATNQLAYEYTGQSIYSRFGSRVDSILSPQLPEGAERTRRILSEHREREGGNKAANGVFKGIWMGNESEDWSQKRAEEHNKSFNEGKGMSGIILEQIMDVWNGGSSTSSKGSEHQGPKK
ncbi:hypothetical protein CDD82_7148 [Ophiocordyceps australis]|uniref:Rhomboid family membrane protein n=1 Tax=Ophiocordyceps australis TaxID=1399860 RepID=A0A2C5ZLX6_9HYPO|nr:hypothetical protein CDD82_7148 [Ophiocordyceps australis]